MSAECFNDHLIVVSARPEQVAVFAIGMILGKPDAQLALQVDAIGTFGVPVDDDTLGQFPLAEHEVRRHPAHRNNWDGWSMAPSGLSIVCTPLQDNTLEFKDSGVPPSASIYCGSVNLKLHGEFSAPGRSDDLAAKIARGLVYHKSLHLFQERSQATPSRYVSSRILLERVRR